PAAVAVDERGAASPEVEIPAVNEPEGDPRPVAARARQAPRDRPLELYAGRCQLLDLPRPELVAEQARSLGGRRVDEYELALAGRHHRLERSVRPAGSRVDRARAGQRHLLLDPAVGPDDPDPRAAADELAEDERSVHDREA